MRGNKVHRGLVLQKRDRHLLNELAVMRLFDRQQAQVVGPLQSVTRANACLLRLTQAGLLNRFYVGTYNGGKKAIYSLSAKGAAVAQIQSPKLLQRQQNKLVVGDPFVDHQLEINEVYLTVKYRPIPAAGIRFKDWMSFSHPLSVASPIIPDGYFELGIPDKTLACFLEIDLGTETAKVWKPKIESYIRFAVSEEFERRFHLNQFRVLVITSSLRRLQALRKLVRQYTDKIFWFTTFESIKHDSFWFTVWLRPDGDQAAVALVSSL